ncbi:MAG: aminotransferase class IV [Flavobacteriales bacterium]|nr:aminotransferase class IV [Flavobacteriales bacterium]
MTKKSYIIFNGKLLSNTEKIFSVNNRAFKYGDALFETIRIIDGKLCFLNDHFERLKKGMKYLQMKSDSFCFEKAANEMLELINKNKIKEGGRLRITLFREADGFYVPLNQSTGYVIEVKSIDINQYQLNKEGLKIDLYNQYQRQASRLSNIKTTNAIPQILAGTFCIDNKLDDCIIVNEHQRLVETTSSNIFLYKKNSIYTPSLDEGCMDGILRKQILKIAEKNRINIFEGTLNANLLLQTDEVFLTNVVRGVQWVKSYKEKTYTNEAALKFVDEINKYISNNA